MSRRARQLPQNPGASLRGVAAGLDLGGSRKYSNENFEGRRGERFHMNSTCTWPEVGSRDWKSAACRAASGAPPAADENLDGRVPPTPGHTHNRIRIGSEGWARGSQFRTHRLSANCCRGKSRSLRAGWGTDMERSTRGTSLGVEQSG
ncbi:hypothetical protein AXF42_Ash013357 [Apostasia shenzhenica]|uniref:Uncharacterized protein n=1 Tax=Apostasia shenzhenica TaxID=1088818 RepID=A0A2I0BBR0_9ASPA|nr:hypothetical protein AXF42_Ash013357 [Apostasia shenzhenica]